MPRHDAAASGRKLPIPAKIGISVFPIPRFPGKSDSPIPPFPGQIGNRGNSGYYPDPGPIGIGKIPGPVIFLAESGRDGAGSPRESAIFGGLDGAGTRDFGVLA